MAENILLPNPPKLVSSEGALAVFEISPLYPGYGITLGNALRRVMLSSIKGSAITRVHFDSVTHEFESIPDVLEDVLDITLNLKQVRVDFPGEEPITLTLDASGKGEVRAKDLKGPGGLIIANPEQLIATLTAPKAALKLSMVVEKGVGFISAETAERDRVEPGTIVLDAIFSPVKNVSYEVDNIRVGDRTDFNLLRLSVETDGTVKPDHIVKEAIEILLKHFSIISDGLK